MSTSNPSKTRPLSDLVEPWYRVWAGKAKTRYNRSFAKAVGDELNHVNFGDRIIIFGASLLLSVLPLVILLSAYANHRIENDISDHLGLSSKGVHVIDGLFRASSHAAFNIGVLIAIVMSLAGTVAVARSIQVLYERTFDLTPARGMRNISRCSVWVLAMSAVIVGDSAIGKTLRDAPVGFLVIGLTEFVIFTVFFWWSMHYLLNGRETWDRTLRGAITTSVMWIGLGVFAAFYFSSSMVTDSQTYGPIGVSFDLVSWFIAIGAVLTLGAVVGAVWQNRRGGAGLQVVKD